VIGPVRDERGFTLVELLIAVTVLGVIMTALGAGFSLALGTINGTSNRLASSQDAQLLGVYLLPDIEGASTIVASSTGAGISCTGAQNPVLQLTDSSTFNVVYGVRNNAGTYQLERYVCTGGSVQSTTVVGRNLASTTAVTPARLPASGTLTGASLTVTEKTTTADSTAYVYTVTGKVRST
jgi:prepilin-type N-terminal cleavage/methylation domain-containing protein